MSEFAGDRLHLGRDHGRDEALEAVDGLGHFNSRLLVLGDVRLVELVNEPRLGVDQVVDFLRFRRRLGLFTGEEKGRERDSSGLIKSSVRIKIKPPLARGGLRGLPHLVVIVQ